MKKAGAEPPTAFDAHILVPPKAEETVIAANVCETLKSIISASAHKGLVILSLDLLRELIIRFSIVDPLFDQTPLGNGVNLMGKYNKLMSI